MAESLEAFYNALSDGQWHEMSEVIQSMPNSVNVKSRAFTELIRIEKESFNIITKVVTTGNPYLEKQKRTLFVRKEF